MEISDKNLESALLKHGLVTGQQLAQVKAELARERSPKSLQNALLDLGLVQEDALLAVRAKELNVPFVQLDELSPDPAIVTLVPEELALDKGLLALEKEGNQLQVAMQNPADLEASEKLSELLAPLSLEARPVLASRGAILRKLSEYHDHYKVKVVEKLMAGIQDQGLQLTQSLGLDIQDLKQVSEQAPVIKTVNLFLLGALLKRASDIHLVPDRKFLHVKYRVDGMLQESQTLSLALAPAVVSRIKIMCRLDIAEKRLPQDGAFHLTVEGREIDFRVAITPTVAGEKVVMRVLDKSAMLLGLDHLGFGGTTLRDFKRLIHKPNGIILIVGPTGSGKTTTLYAALKALNTGDKNITTVEDPVEYEIEGLTQIQTHADIGLNFAAVLRSVLRQDPDIVLVGEIRDLETTEIAVRAALTGHLVFATLHTNDAAGAVARLCEMGAEPYLIASALRCAMSQRLVRNLCPHCREVDTPDAETLARLKPHTSLAESEIRVFRGKGCRHCFQTGYRGRTVVAELLTVDEQIRRQIVLRAPSSDIHAAALKQGMRTMFQDGVDKVLRGVTSVEEMLDVCEDKE
jgi:type IV pilus assembly protein PilB